jgi:molybdopterin molybdotransferase
MLVAALTGYHYAVTAIATAPDNAARIARTMRQCLARSDVLLVTGGVSVGDYDLVPDAIQRLGAVVRFHKVAIKPGKPILFATCPDGRCIFALPGNPLSAMNGFFEFVLPALGRLGGTAPGRCRPVVWARLASGSIEGDRRQKHVLGRILWQDSGPHVEIVRSVGTADLVAGGRADGAIMIPVGVDRIRAGDAVAFRPWRSLP